MSIQELPVSTEVPVLIVGGGPVGLGLALELAYRNIRSLLIEQTDGIVRLSKMGHVSVRSMEHCRRWGVSEQVRDCGFPKDYPLNQVFCTSLNGQHIGTIEYPSFNDEKDTGLSPERKQRCPQLWFDPILARAAAKQPLITVRNQTRLTDLKQDLTGVTAATVDPSNGRESVVRAGYCVGCDGAGSTVRQALGLKLEGEVLSYSVGIYFTAPRLIEFHKMGMGTRYWLIGEEGTWGNLTVVDGKDHWRLTITGSQEKVEAKNFDAAYWLRRCLGRDDIPHRIDAVLPWRRPRMLANHYGSGRVYLAGDACHVNAPNGGFGMNTGLGDAVDIGWKLQGVIEGWAAPELLDSYELERRPIARRNVDAAARNFTLTKPRLTYAHVEEDGAVGDATRAALRTVLVRDTLPEWETTGAHLGYRYEGSPVLLPDGTPEPADDLSVYVPCARPGHRAPHFALQDGRSILDLFGRGFVLLQFAAEVGDAAEEIVRAALAIGMPLEVVRIDDAAAGMLYGRSLVLVRPDGHVAWRGDSLDRTAQEIAETVTGRRLTQARVAASASHRVAERT